LTSLTVALSNITSALLYLVNNHQTLSGNFTKRTGKSDLIEVGLSRNCFFTRASCFSAVTRKILSTLVVPS